MTKFLAFDIEIATEPDMSRDWSEQHPFGITCAATWASGEDKPRVWCGHYTDTGDIAESMNTVDLERMIRYMMEMNRNGYQIVTVNGAGFDFRELQSNLFRDIDFLVTGHVDCFFDVFCRLGYSPGLDAMSKGMGLPGKMQGVDGASAPVLWANGEYGRVLSYVAQDAKQTLDLAEAVEAAGELRWTAKSGNQNVLKIDKWLTVAEAIQLPEPDVSWMDNPWPRSKFVGWLQ